MPRRKKKLPAGQPRGQDEHYQRHLEMGFGVCQICGYVGDGTYSTSDKDDLAQHFAWRHGFAKWVNVEGQAGGHWQCCCGETVPERGGECDDLLANRLYAYHVKRDLAHHIACAKFREIVK